MRDELSNGATILSWDAEEIAEEIGIPTDNWPGNCALIVRAIMDIGIIGAEYRRGHWLGPGGFTQHSWMEFPGGLIVDPTRWVFENREPYIYVGRNDYYDTGSNALRIALRNPCPAFNPAEPSANLDIQPEAAAAYIGEFISVQSEALVPYITKSQAFWLANCSPGELGAYVRETYTALVKAGMKAAIPIDNYRMFMR